MYKYRKLRGRICEKYDTQERFAGSINQSKVAVSNKLNGKTSFNQKSMKLWADALDIPVEEYSVYFFEK